MSTPGPIQPETIVVEPTRRIRISGIRSGLMRSTASEVDVSLVMTRRKESPGAMVRLSLLGLSVTRVAARRPAMSDGQKVLFEVNGTNGKKTFRCGTTGEKVYVDGESSENYVECPNVEIFCHFETLKCPNECSFNGRCTVVGTCECYAGWGEKDCSVKGGTNYNGQFDTGSSNNGNTGSATGT